MARLLACLAAVHGGCCTSQEGGRGAVHHVHNGLTLEEGYLNAPSRSTHAYFGAHSPNTVISIGRVTVDSMDAPLGVTSLAPAFTWTLTVSGARNVSQLAFEYLLSSTPGLKGDVFDSGRVALSQSANNVYAGPPLAAGQVYYVSVRAWTSAATDPTAYSPPVRFSIGLQSLADWRPTTSYISLTEVGITAAPWLRTSVMLSAADVAAVASGAASALLHIASAGFHTCFVNGVQLGNVSGKVSVLAPSVADLSQTIPAVTYDAAAALVAGENVIGLWLGAGWAGYPTYGFNKAPLALAELRITPAAGAAAGAPNISVGTDGSWKARASTRSQRGSWTSGDFGGELIDWRADVPGWATAAVDASGWDNAVVTATNDAGGRVVIPQCLEPTTVLDDVPAASVTNCPNASAGCYLITMERIFSGWLTIDALDAEAGTTVSLQYTTVPGSVVEYGQVDAVIVSQPGQGFSNAFNYHEMQYVTIGPLSSAPSASSIRGHRLMNARRRFGSFASSDAGLDAVYGAFIDTYVGLAQQGYTVDCPHRERQGYGGDGHGTLEMAMATFDSTPFFSKFAQDWRDVQEPSGDLPHTAPTKLGGGGPAWGTFSIDMPYALFLSSGDVRPMAATYPTMRRYLDFLQAHVNASSGLLEPTEELSGFWNFLGDWYCLVCCRFSRAAQTHAYSLSLCRITPHGSEGSDSIEALLFNNCILTLALRVAADVADVLQDSAGAAQLRANATAVGAATHHAFYLPASGVYLDARQTHQVMPLVAGLVPPALFPTVLASLVHTIVISNASHLDVGLSGTYFTERLLSSDAVRREDLLYATATNPTAPSYAAFLNAGFTTFPETWDLGRDQSQIHGCFGGYSSFFSGAALGVRPSPLGPGYTQFIVRPAYGVGGVSWATGTVGTPLGLVSIAWTAAAADVTLALTVPAGAVATVFIPAVSPADVTEGGSPASSAAGVSFVDVDGPFTIWRVASGVYAFSSSSAAPLWG
jgi:alpha-L-rhamnosidase